jgi:hypothetical protein
MDDIDNYFGEDACDAFVSGIKIDGLDDGDKREFAKNLIENEDMLKQSVLGANYEMKEGTFIKMTPQSVVDTLVGCELAGIMYPKDKNLVQSFITENRRKDNYNKQDLLDIAKMLIKRNI